MATQLSKHFWRHEFACKCGCGYDTVDTELLPILEVAREFVRHKVTPNSGHRCLKHNRAIGGAAGSYHLKGQACDFPTHKCTQLYEYLDKMYPERFGFILYTKSKFVHIDCRSYKYRSVRDE